MTNQELCLLLDSILGLLETGNTDRAISVIKNGLIRIDKGQTASSEEQQKTDENKR